MRGVEEMFLPLDDAEVDRQIPWDKFQEMRAEERRVAEKKVYEGLKHWVDFFERSEKYVRVGRVKREEGWEEGEPRRGLCRAAEKGRGRRKVPKEVV